MGEHHHDEEDLTTFSLGGGPASEAADSHTDGVPTDEPAPRREGPAAPATESPEEVLGLSIPEEHVGAFVAEVFEDPERTTTWDSVVGALVAPAAREDWAALSPTAQVAEVLERSSAYDEEAADALEAIPTDGSATHEEVLPAFAEARRLRRNADAFRDGVADAFASGHVDDEELVDALQRSGFETDPIRRRETELERVTGTFDLDCRPYGGTLLEADETEPEPRGPGAPETF